MINVTPRPSGDAGYLVVPAPPAYTTRPQTADPVQAWARQRQQVADLKLRTPVALGAQRLRLSDERCRELQETHDELRERLRNAPPSVEQRHMISLEKVAIGLADELHKERISTWMHMRDLMEPLQDASLEKLRTSWLSEIARLAGRGDHR